MKQTDLILLARAVANESEAKGFKHTADAMRLVIEDLLQTCSVPSATDILTETTVIRDSRES